MQNAVIIHHGIKGQKWGVRRFQNEDGSLTNAGEKRYGQSNKRPTLGDRIARKRSIYGKLSDEKEIWGKGTVTNRVTSDAKADAKKNGYTYVSKGDDWKLYYEFGFGNQLMQRPVKDKLVSPSEKERIDIFIDMAKDKRMADIMAGELAKGRLVFKSKSKAQKDIARISERSVTRTNRAELSDMLYNSKIVREEYFKRVKDRGYNAIADDSDRLASFGMSSLIVLNQETSLGEMRVKDI